MKEYLLTLIVFIPLVFAVGICVVPSRFRTSIKVAALVATGLQLVLSLILFFRFNTDQNPVDWASGFQFTEQYQWIALHLGNYGWFVIDYYVGVDGISLPLVILSALLLFIGVISSWKVEDQAKGYFILYLILSTSIIGCFVALDLFLFYLFFEFMLLPMFFLIGIWGGTRRSYASVKFFLYTLLGSLMILIVMVALYLSTEDVDRSLQMAQKHGAIEQVHTFSLVKMMEGSYGVDALLSPLTDGELMGVPLRYLAFILLMVGFAIKLPVVPLHTWLPDAHVEAPTAISVILAGLLLKVGGYGIFRIAYSIFPDGAIVFAYPIALVGLVAIVYGGLTAMAQNDLKRLVAYSSVSHMGFVLLGLSVLTAEGVSGSLFQMVSHGLISGALFIIVGVLYDRTHDRKIENVSGLASKMPVFTFFTVTFFFASLGLPGMSGFVGELLVLIGGIGGESINGLVPSWVGMLAVSGIIISAAYFLWTLQRMFFGKFWTREQAWEINLRDLDKREWVMLFPLALLVLMLGLFPGILFERTQESVEFFTETVLSTGRRYLDLY